MKGHLAAAFGLLFTLVVADRAACQCGAQWLPGGGIAGTDGTIWAAHGWNGGLVVGGGFGLAGGLPTPNIAAWDPTTGAWSSVGGGIFGEVRAFATLPNGDLLVAGGFAAAGPVAAVDVAIWNGTSWSALGSGIDGDCYDVAASPSGTVYAGGAFATAGGVAAANVARWDGSNWSGLGSGTNGWVEALAILPNGDLVVGGYFTIAGGVAAANIARWDGTVWSSIGAGLFGGQPGAVRALAVLPNGDLVAAGGPTGSYQAVQRWTGSAWVPIGFVVGQVYGMTVLANGDLVVTNDRVRRWNGSAWSTVGELTGWLTSVGELPNGDLFAAGPSPTLPGTQLDKVARWDGTSWLPLGAGTNDAVLALKRRANGGLLAGGAFQWIEGTAANRIAEWNGASWAPLGTGTNGTVYAIAELPNGDIIAGGAFGEAGGVPAHGIARWDGTTWTAIGPTSTQFPLFALMQVRSLAVLPNGDLLVGSSGYAPLTVLRWDGTTWSSLGTGLTGSVLAFAVHPNGDVFAGGSLTVAGPPSSRGVARWNGTTWSSLGSGLLDGSGSAAAYALAIAPSGDLIVGGSFGQAGSVSTNAVARWDGAAWRALGTGLSPVWVNALAILPDGDVVAGGDFNAAGSVPTSRIARWDGTAWSSFGAGLGWGGVHALSATEDGEVVVGGKFHRVLGSTVSSRLARLGSTCPATAQTLGVGCATGASIATAVDDLPWLGSAFRARTAGFSPNALALDVFGLAPTTVPLVSLLPQGQLGCSLHVRPDLVGVVLPVAGEATTSLAIPVATILVGQVFHHQVLGLDIIAGGIASLTAADAHTLTIGAF